MATSDDALSRQVQLEITRRRNDATRAFERERSSIAERMAAEGTLNTGGIVLAVEDAARLAFSAFAEGATTALIELAQLRFGDIDDEAAQWIRGVFEQQVEPMAIGLGQTISSLRLARGVPDRPEMATECIVRAREDRDIRLGRLLLRKEFRRLAHDPEADRPAGKQFDLFISHASEDKDGVARPLAEEIKRRGYTVWLDEAELTIGDGLYTSIDRALAACKYGVVVLSHQFFRKNWPKRELSALAAIAAAEDRKVILPIWHGLEHSDVTRYSPQLADILAAQWSAGIENVVGQIENVLGSVKRQAEGPAQHAGIASGLNSTRPRIKWGSYQFEGDAQLYCIKCFETKGLRHPTIRLNIRQRQCAVCQTVVSAG